MACLRYMALLSTFIMLVATGFLEPDVLSVLPPWRGSGAFYGMFALNCCFAFSSNLGNFLVTKYTSPLTIQVGFAAAWTLKTACFSTTPYHSRSPSPGNRTLVPKPLI